MASPADDAHVRCEKDAITLKDPVVRAFRDGVHFVIENPGDVWGFELHPQSWKYGQAMGGNLSGDVTTGTWSVPPGRVTVTCLPTSDSSYSDPGVPEATLTIVDPDGLYVAWDLACGFGEQFRIKIGASTEEDPDAVFRRIPGIRASDQFRKPNYPESPEHWPTVIVFRDGRAIARIGAPVIGSEWELLVSACPRSGITKT